MDIEIVYDRDCPNVTAARTQLLQAFALLGRPARWREWDSADPATPVHARGWGSPTILVDGRDVGGLHARGDGPACRIYIGTAGAAAGQPAARHIAAAIRDAASLAPAGARNRLLPLTLAPGVALTLLPKLFCPLCWPLYTSVLGALGLTFINYTPLLYPLTGLFLAGTVAALGGTAPTGTRTLSVTAGTVAAGAIMAGKFHLDNGWLVFSGILLLAFAAVISVARRRGLALACRQCD